MKPENRLEFLDGMRGLAILMVVFLHYIVQMYEIPRSIHYNQNTPLPNLDLGVPLFFVISGFVIFMTLEKTPGFISFMVRRWIRLFPAMLAATLIIFAVAHFLPHRVGGIPRLIDLVPGISLLGANAISALSGVQTDGLERGFWSIYVEFRFYVMFGVCFYVLGKYRSFFAMTALSIVLLGLMQAADLAGARYSGPAHSLFGKMLLGHHLPWFLLGMHIYLYRFRSHWLVLALIIANALVQNAQTVGSLLATAGVVVLIYAAFEVESVQRFFRSRILLFFGFISYPLYLLNDSLGRGMISGLYAAVPESVPFEMLSLVALMPIAFAAWCLARYVEPTAQKWLKQHLTSRSRIKLMATPLKES